ncbi:hypothetical protein DFH09DRAFT_1275626 [Mycena vulgaris]|nr:hypothetical protein DFH09DRAFT_1275626 [Mycena vulgaris]
MPRSCESQATFKFAPWFQRSPGPYVLNGFPLTQTIALLQNIPVVHPENVRSAFSPELANFHCPRLRIQSRRDTKSRPASPNATGVPVKEDLHWGCAACFSCSVAIVADFEAWEYLPVFHQSMYRTEPSVTEVAPETYKSSSVYGRWVKELIEAGEREEQCRGYETIQASYMFNRIRNADDRRQSRHQLNEREGAYSITQLNRFNSSQLFDRTDET